MKPLRLIVLVVFCASLLPLTDQGQVTARRLTRRVAPQPVQTNGPVRPTAPPAPAITPMPTPTTPTTAVVRPTPTQPMVRVIQPAVDPEKARAAKEEALRKTIEFQKKRAEEGSESAQYELGMRYLKGDGLEKDDATGRKWLQLSAKNGYGPAAKKLEDLDKPPAPPKSEKAAE